MKRKSDFACLLHRKTQDFPQFGKAVLFDCRSALTLSFSQFKHICWIESFGKKNMLSLIPFIPCIYY